LPEFLLSSERNNIHNSTTNHLYYTKFSSINQVGKNRSLIPKYGKFVEKGNG
jgi:hypothetical protein